jgi:4-methyl-5(b-hydroxyethyl)-thiazole monophosphate biosynthesis
MIYLFLAEGFEEIEALATVDLLRRAELEVATVGVGRKTVTGSHGIPVVADVMDCEVIPDENLDCVILPGGLPGTLNLEKSQTVQSFIDFAAKNGKLICAICAAPSILGHKGLLKGKNAISYDGFVTQLEGAIISDKPVCRDGNFITAAGAGVSIDFALEIIKVLHSEAEAKRIKDSIKCIQ